MHHNHHLEWDLVYWAVFVLGQSLFMLKRADLARRSKLNAVPTIRAYFALNWVPLLFRSAVEWGIALWPYRSASVTFLTAIIQRIWPSFPFQIPQHRGLVGCFFVGMGSDLLMDWLVMQSWVKSVPILNKLVENIPQLPEVQQLVNNLPAKEGA